MTDARFQRGQLVYLPTGEYAEVVDTISRDGERRVIVKPRKPADADARTVSRLCTVLEVDLQA